jgi:hypothetical protein
VPEEFDYLGGTCSVLLGWHVFGRVARVRGHVFGHVFGHRHDVYPRAAMRVPARANGVAGLSTNMLRCASSPGPPNQIAAPATAGSQSGRFVERSRAAGAITRRA